MIRKSGLFSASVALCFSLSVSLLPSQSFATNTNITVLPNETDGLKIMLAMEDRDDGTSNVSKSKLTTCRYGMKAKKLVCVENPRIKLMEGVRKDYGETEQDKKSVSILLDPPGERGIGFLQYDYDDKAKESDQWMYFSALGKVKRIVSGSDDEPKTGSFFGSEFAYEDMEKRHLEDYNYKILKQNVKYQGRDCWVIESTPNPERSRKSNYSRSVIWVDKERLLGLKTMLYDRQGKRAKRLTTRKVKLIDNIWVGTVLNINNLQTKRMSTLVTQELAFNINVDDNFLTQRTLTDNSYRENRLQDYREHLQN